MNTLWETIRPALETLTQPFPDEAYRLANAHREECTPALLAGLAHAADLPLTQDDGRYWLHIHAMYLLAQWRETAALAPLLRLCRRTEAELEQLIGEDITEGLPCCLASVCGDDTNPLRALASDPHVSHWIRHAALVAWVIRVLQCAAPRAPFLDFLLAQGEAEATRLRRPRAKTKAFELIDSIVGALLEIGATEAVPQVRRWYADGLCDPEICPLPYFLRHVEEPQADKQARLMQPGYGLIVDAAAELREWACFKTEAQLQTEDAARRAQQQAAPPKPGRNDACPCGSGKKYKKCCGQ